MGHLKGFILMPPIEYIILGIGLVWLIVCWIVREPDLPTPPTKYPAPIGTLPEPITNQDDQ